VRGLRTHVHQEVPRACDLVNAEFGLWNEKRHSRPCSTGSSPGAGERGSRGSNYWPTGRITRPSNSTQPGAGQPRASSACGNSSDRLLENPSRHSEERFSRRGNLDFKNRNKLRDCFAEFIPMYIGARKAHINIFGSRLGLTIETGLQNNVGPWNHPDKDF
jgi:hypothetical protein